MGQVMLPIAHIRQKPGLCGATTAQMILHAKGLVTDTEADQVALNKTIQDRTNFKRPTKNVEDSSCPKWPEQLCTKCPGEPAKLKHICWCTYPPALRATMAERGAVVRQRSAADAITLTGHVIDCIDGQQGAAALVENGLHWIAVIGYAEGTGPADSEQIRGRWISDLYVHDPNQETGATGVPIREWLDTLLTPVLQCGAYRDKVVVITTP